jgi:hypothetical protein
LELKKGVQEKTESLQKSLKSLLAQSEKTKLLLENFIPGAANELQNWRI